jgi:hypothetical protein
MAANATELFPSRKRAVAIMGPNDSAELLFIIKEAADDDEALITLRNALPNAFNGLALLDYDIERLGVEEWAGRGQYGLPSRSGGQVGESFFNFDTSGGTVHITQAKENIQNYPIGQAPDHKGAIGVTKEGVEGTDIGFGGFAFSETHYFDRSRVTTAYKKTLRDLSWKVNNASFRGFSAGEVVFKGARGSQRGKEDYEITFQFEANENLTAYSFVQNPAITGDKKGWEYAWVEYKDDEDPVTKRKIQVPLAVHVERVYDTANFALLGIGVAE